MLKLEAFLKRGVTMYITERNGGLSRITSDGIKISKTLTAYLSNVDVHGHTFIKPRTQVPYTLNGLDFGVPNFDRVDGNLGKLLMRTFHSSVFMSLKNGKFCLHVIEHQPVRYQPNSNISDAFLPGSPIWPIIFSSRLK